MVIIIYLHQLLLKKVLLLTLILCKQVYVITRMFITVNADWSQNLKCTKGK